VCAVRNRYGNLYRDTLVPMANTDRVVLRKGLTGKRGAQGARGPTGAKGRRGDSGKPGPKGLRGLRGPLHQDDVLERVVTHFDDLYQQLSGHLKRIARMQHQLDELTAAVPSLLKSVRRQTDVQM
jgi:hypothetical protein